MNWTLTIVGLILLVPCTLVCQVGARSADESIAPHRRPRIAFDPKARAIFNLVWLLLLIGTLGFLIAGSGWWTLLMFPGGMAVVGIVRGILRI